MAFHEPSPAEVTINSLLLTIIEKPFYKNYVDGMGLKGDERVLEFGPGTGKMSKHIVRALPHGHLTIVDLSKNWLEAVGKVVAGSPNVDLKQGKIMNIPLSDGSFDVVVASFVIHDVDDIERRQVVDRLAALLKKGGRMYVRDPELNGRSGHGITPAELRRVMQGSGLKEVTFERLRPWFMGPLNQAVYVKE
jgi:ubiquinone/menaquinone biosynthesis C-methylase UbiE